MDETLLQMMNEYKTIFEVLDIKVSYKKKTLNIGVLNSPFIECTIPSSKNSKKNSASKKNKKNAFQIKIHKNVFKKIKNKMNKETFKNTLNIEKINEHLSILLQLLQQIQRKEKKSTKKTTKHRTNRYNSPLTAGKKRTTRRKRKLVGGYTKKQILFVLLCIFSISLCGIIVGAITNNNNIITPFAIFTVLSLTPILIILYTWNEIIDYDPLVTHANGEVIVNSVTIVAYVHPIVLPIVIPNDNDSENPHIHVVVIHPDHIIDIDNNTIDINNINTQSTILSGVIQYVMGYFRMYSRIGPSEIVDIPNPMPHPTRFRYIDQSLVRVIEDRVYEQHGNIYIDVNDNSVQSPQSSSISLTDDTRV